VTTATISGSISSNY